MKIISNNKFNEMDYKAINNIKALAIDMIDAAGSGHPGIALSAAPIIYDVYAKHLVFDANNDKWYNRDRFIMSAGHGSALLYATLFMSGFNLTIEDLQNFRKLGSKTPGHPELSVTPGVDFGTGPLGQGISSAVGIAIGEKFLNNRYLYGKNKSLVDHFTYCLCGDGDIMEGVAMEAASIAGNLNLGKLIVLYDSNNMTLDTDTSLTLKENVLAKFKAMNWDTHLVTNGNDLEAIDNAISKAKQKKDKPSIIEIKTVLGQGSILENTNTVHGKPLTKEDISVLKQKLEIRDVPFTVLGEAISYMQQQILQRNEKIIDKYNKLCKFTNKKTKEFKKEFNYYLKNNHFEYDTNIALEPEEYEEKSGREISHTVLNKLSKDNLFLTLSADLATSTLIKIDDDKYFSNQNQEYRNIPIGVREHAMAAIANGIASTGIKVYASTFLSFSDYLKPAIRMSSLMNLPVTYVFTHDSIAVGEDGPTHIPVEQLVGLRSIPNLDVYRPFDANEIIGAYKTTLQENKPSVLVISKEKVKTSSLTSINDTAKGAYIVKDFKIIDGIIISTGKEVEEALEISDNLEQQNLKFRVVSMPSMEKFESQDEKYKNEILPKNVKKVVIEYSSSYSWYKYTTEEYLFNVNDFGKSGNKNEIIKSYKLDQESITNKISELFEHKKGI